MDDVISIRTSGYATIALKSNGTVFTWGTARYLGGSTLGTYNAASGQKTNNATPIQVLQGLAVSGRTQNFLERVTDIEINGISQNVGFYAVQDGNTAVWWSRIDNVNAVFAATATNTATPLKFANGNTTYGNNITRLHGRIFKLQTHSCRAQKRAYICPRICRKRHRCDRSKFRKRRKLDYI